MPRLIGFNTPPSSHVARDNGSSKASNPDLLKGKVVSAGEDDAASVADGSPLNDFPLVRLDVDVITDSIAGRLATSLLGHVLYLKNQIPFPVMRLERIPRGQNVGTNTRVDKLRTEFLATFDTLSSHMDTTFSALSTALSRCSDYKDCTMTRAYLAILLGPSREYAKSKVMLGIDGLENRIWGNHVKNVSGALYASDDEKEAQDAGSETESDDGAEVPDDSESEEESEEEDEDESANDGRTSSPPPPAQSSYASEQRFLQNAVRLLSRTLAAADVDGKGIISEMSPTQTHILIRAPRRFSHPAWIPRQKISTSLDATLCDFLDCSGLSTSRNSKKSHVEGVWITSRAGIQKETTDQAPSRDPRLKQDQDDDEMIWWSWEGKLVGFSDW